MSEPFAGNIGWCILTKLTEEDENRGKSCMVVVVMGWICGEEEKLKVTRSALSRDGDLREIK